MIGTIRKHSAWLWWIVAGLTIISFVIFMFQGGIRGGGSGRNGAYGVLYGQPVTAEEVAAAENEFRLFYWMRTHEFPEKKHLSRSEMDQGIYQRLLLAAKAKQLGIHVSTEAQARVANSFLQSLGRNGEVPKIQDFTEQVLQPAGLTLADLQRAIADDLAVEQMQQLFGLPGALVPPQEASQLYDREHQEVSAQAVFFSATNYASQITVTPSVLSQFYTNFMAHYRLPDRVQLYYVAFDFTNFLADANRESGKTNFAAQAEAYYNQHGLSSVPDAKTPEEAKAKIREEFLRQAEGRLAVQQARQFVTKLYAMEPVAGSNLVTLAQSSGLAVHTTAPFTEEEGPAEFAASADLVKIAFKLNPDSPYSKALPCADALYVIGLAKQLPSAIQPFNQIYSRVSEDYRYYEGALKARAAATNFYYSSVVQMATGKSFAQVAVAAGLAPVALPPFSLSSQAIPEVEGHVQLGQIKNAAFSTSPGHISPVEATQEGAFMLYVQTLLPVDEATKTANLPQFLTQIRRNRQNEAFDRWLTLEENRELANTPVAEEIKNEKSASRSE